MFRFPLARFRQFESDTHNLEFEICDGYDLISLYGLEYAQEGPGLWRVVHAADAVGFD
jgi:hypothetical protein